MEAKTTTKRGIVPIVSHNLPSYAHVLYLIGLTRRWRNIRPQPLAVGLLAGLRLLDQVSDS